MIYTITAAARSLRHDLTLERLPGMLVKQWQTLHRPSWDTRIVFRGAIENNDLKSAVPQHSKDTGHLIEFVDRE